jgi:DNA repair protein RecO (recombination protein O)
MSRLFTYTALILRARPSGESNREIWFLSAEEGLLKATVFGGPKSKFRAQAAPYHQGRLWIYHDPVKDSRKLTDFDVLSWRPGLRELYERSAAAAAIAETILAGHGGGGHWEAALNLASGTLDALETAGEDACKRILIHFLWNWADILGVRPDPDHCGVCACEPPENDLLWYDDSEGALLCPSCIDLSSAIEEKSSKEKSPKEKSPKEKSPTVSVDTRKTGDPHPVGLLPLGSGGRRWLKAVQGMEPRLLTRYTLDSPSQRQVWVLVTAILAGALGKRLGTWDF